LADTTGKVILKPEYTEIKSEYYSAKGTIDEADFTYYYDLSSANGLKGRANFEGTILIATKYLALKNISPPSNWRTPPQAYIFQQTDKKYGTIDLELKTIIPPLYNHLEAKYFDNDTTCYFLFSNTDRYNKYEEKLDLGLLDAKGKVLIEPYLTKVESLSKTDYSYLFKSYKHHFFGRRFFGRAARASHGRLAQKIYERKATPAPLFAYAKLAKNILQQVIDTDFARDFAQGTQRVANVHRQPIARHAAPQSP
jgi:hypothetical protein